MASELIELILVILVGIGGSLLRGLRERERRRSGRPSPPPPGGDLLEPGDPSAPPVVAEPPVRDERRVSQPWQDLLEELGRLFEEEDEEPDASPRPVPAGHWRTTAGGPPAPAALEGEEAGPGGGPGRLAGHAREEEQQPAWRHVTGSGPDAGSLVPTVVPTVKGGGVSEPVAAAEGLGATEGQGVLEGSGESEGTPLPALPAGVAGFGAGRHQEPAAAARPTAGPIHTALRHSIPDVRLAVLWAEVFSAPRALRPWRPGGHRSPLM